MVVQALSDKAASPATTIEDFIGVPSEKVRLSCPENAAAW
jgi:hypothetical protein